MNAEDHFRLFLYLYNVIPFTYNLFDLRVVDLLDSDKLAFDPDLVPVSALADVHTVKLLSKVYLVHPEAAVILLEIRVNLVPGLFSPQLTVFAPVALPVKHAPRVPYVQQFMALAILLDNLLALNYTVTVSG